MHADTIVPVTIKSTHRVVYFGADVGEETTIKTYPTKAWAVVHECGDMYGRVTVQTLEKYGLSFEDADAVARWAQGGAK